MTTELTSSAAAGGAGRAVSARVWVRNMADLPLSFNVTGLNGKTSTVLIPKTWVPVDLTEQARAADILESPNFRLLLNRTDSFGNRFVLRVKSSVARKILSSDAAKKEVIRLNRARYGSTMLEARRPDEPVDTAPPPNVADTSASINDVRIARLKGIQDQTELVNEIILLRQSGGMSDKMTAEMKAYASAEGYGDALVALDGGMDVTLT